MATSGHPGKVGGEQAAKSSNLGGGLGGGGNGGNQGGMSPGLLDSKYPGAKGKKTKQYEASLKNLAKVGTIMAGLTGGPVGSLVSGAATAADAIANGTNPIAGALDPFSGQMADANNVGAGYAQGSDTNFNRALDPAQKRAEERNKPKAKKQPLTKGFTLLANAGGTLLGT